MGGLAVLAKRLGHTVTGSDANVYPPMSTQLEAEGIQLMRGYSAENLKSSPDIVVIGNALSRGNEEVEAVLNQGLAYTSGAQWLSEHVLQNRWVLAVAGTHGKTTSSSMLAWILEYAGKTPGFLIGGVPLNFGVSATLGDSKYFVIEADEYDTAFFDKRSKFVHYRPKTCVLNNLEFDHADIFDDLDAIKRQFHHLVRTVPSAGLIIRPENDDGLKDVLNTGCWTPVETLGEGKQSSWSVADLSAGEGAFNVLYQNTLQGRVNWSLSGQHNVSNALGAIAAANHVGVDPVVAIDALNCFQNVKRRLELRAEINNIRVYDDFAHHPTAIATTLSGLRGKVGDERIIAILEPRSNTMKMGVHQLTLLPSLEKSDQALIYIPEDMGWALDTQAYANVRVFSSIDELIEAITQLAKQGDHLLFMSNGGFAGIHQSVEDILGRTS